MKTSPAHLPPRLLQLLRSLIYAVVLWGSSAYAQDPPQYGTPFANVPDPRDVNMYQAHIRPYSAAGNLAGVTARLDNIRALGINVIYLMPVYPHGTDAKSSNSPYCVKDHKAIAAEYGTLNDLRALVDGAHSRGMAVIMDFIPNQTSWDHPWITQHPDWYERDASGNIIALFPDVAKLNFANTAMRAALIDAMRYWIFAANIDGYRYDYANNAPLDFWSAAISNLRGITSHKLLLFAEGDRLENFQAGFDLNFGDKWYYDAIKPIANGTSVAQIQTTTNTEYTYAAAAQQVVRYTANHDTQNNETAIGVFRSHAGVIANFMVSAYMRGVPFLTSGQEVDFNQTIPWPYTSVKINWTANPGAAADFTKVLNFRDASVAIRRGTMTNYSNANVCAFTKVSGSEKVIVIVNLRNATSTYVIPSELAGNYSDAYTNAAVTLTSGATHTLAAFQYIVLKNTACTPSAITPYVSVNGGAFTQTSAATLTAGGSVTFGPQPLTGGSWSWTGPNGYSASTREITLSNVQTNQSGNYTATYTNASGCPSNHTFTLTVNPAPSNLPAPWQTSDIGAVATAGSASYANGTFTVNGSGADVFDFADEFRFVYQQFSGNVTVTARVGSLTNTNAWAKAGVMIRETLAANASNAAMLLTPSNGFNFQYRNGTGAGSTAAGNAGGTIPNWVRITRSGNTLTGYRSTNGTTWTQTGSVTITMPAAVYIGFFATSHNDGVVTAATFTNVAVTGGANTPPVANAGPDKSLAAGTTSTTLPGSGSDPDGNPVTYTWSQVSGPAATITNGTTATATVSNLTNGNTYVFALTVNDGSLTASDQVQVSVSSAATYYALQNRWTGTYLYDAGANAGYGTTIANNNYKWEKVTVDGTYFRLRNLGTGEFMHIENQTGSVQCTAADASWWSGQWSQDYIDGTWVRFRNRWQTASIIHVENQTGFAQYAGGQDGWYSAQWRLVSTSGRAHTGTVGSLEADASLEGNRLVEIYPNPARGNQLNIMIDEIEAGEKADVLIRDMNGKLAVQRRIGESGVIVHDLKPGLYLVLVQTRKIHAVRKLIIE
ncbi:MAG TPA: alpha-amylase family glycosyl hydrolase [Chryseosolibacter sp.]|nr:alpha-amylase family glycosyl hydrolase [Chryseosolibacter sp.]